MKPRSLAAAALVSSLVSCDVEQERKEEFMQNPVPVADVDDVLDSVHKKTLLEASQPVSTAEESKEADEPLLRPYSECKPTKAELLEKCGNRPDGGSFMAEDRYYDCRDKMDGHYYAVDRNGNGLRDNLNSGNVYCSQDKSLEDRSAVQLPNGKEVKLVHIEKPRRTADASWDWQRGNEDAFDPSRDLAIQHQSGRSVDHKYLAELAKILPSSWTLAAMPDSESGNAMATLFDCCDLSARHWVAEHAEYIGVSPSQATVVKFHGGFAVTTPGGLYAFEPGGTGNLRWNAETTGPLDGSGTGYPERSTRASVIRRGNRDAAYQAGYWDSGDGDWGEKTLPAAAKGIQYILGGKAFWIAERDLANFEGNDDLRLISGKQVDSGRNFYKVQFAD